MRIAPLVVPIPLLSLALACGGSGAVAAPGTPPSSPQGTSASTTRGEPESKGAPAVPAPTPGPAPADAIAEKCEGGWTCVKVSFAKKKVEPRETKLLGDPKIESTWSKTSDGRTVTLDAFSQGPVDLALKRKPNNKNEVVAKLGKNPEMVIDSHEGGTDDFTYISLIATEQAGDLLVDIRYMK